MINIIFTPNMFLSGIFVIAILLLYGLRTVRPEISRDEDIFFVTIGLFYSGILAVHGWRLDPILVFSQGLIIITAIFAGWENIRLRGIVNYLNDKDEKEKRKNQKPRKKQKTK